MPAATFIVIDPPSNTPQHHRLRPSAQRPAAQTVSPARPLLITQRCHDDPPIEHTLTTGEAVVHDDDWDDSYAGSLIVADAGMNPRVPNALQIRVALVGIEPAIWRRLIVPRSFHLGQLHRVIQAAFGWRGLPPARVPHRRLVLS